MKLIIEITVINNTIIKKAEINYYRKIFDQKENSIKTYGSIQDPFLLHQERIQK